LAAYNVNNRKRTYPLLKKINDIMKVLLCYFFTVAHVNADDSFKIDIKPVAIYAQADNASELVKTLYQANNIEVISLNEKWAKVSLIVEQEKIIGWVEKIYLKSQESEVDTDNSAKLEVMDIALDDEIQELYIVKSSTSKLQCVETEQSNNINGCFVYIDLELKGAVDSRFADVSCAAKFEVSSISTKIITQEKKVRTPLKEGVGAVRLQIAMMPLFEREVSSINLLSYTCRVEKMY
jgi:hypothetical protein